MLFTSLRFLIFLPLTAIIYFLIPGKLRPAWLLAISYGFCVAFGIGHLLPIIGVSVMSYGCGLLMEKYSGNKRPILVTGVSLSVLILVLFKYTGFILDNINGLLSLTGGEALEMPFSIVQPIGLSYLTLQIISYMVDIYKGEIPAERNLINYGLYVAFFPKILSGPIEKAGGFLRRIREIPDIELFDAVRIRDGFTRMMWGYFLKLVISDRLAGFVDTVFGSYTERGRVVLFLGMCGYCLQLCADFIGSMDIAIGMGKVLGIQLSENFRGSLFSRTVRESWQRWHITLGEWLKEYVYFPLGGSRKGEKRTMMNRVLVFAASGLWHGAAWHYVVWGLLNGFYEIIEVYPRALYRTKSRIWDWFCVVRTWIFWGIALTFFRSVSVRDTLAFFYRMLTVNDTYVIKDGSLFEMGISVKMLCFLIIALLAMAVVEYMRYKWELSDIAPIFGRLHIAVRYTALLLLLMIILIFGAYGPAYNAANFIYFGF